MKYAIVNDERQEATESGLRATCPGCGGEMLSRCGDIKINHWAHISKSHCDDWWEPETQWHRDWKNHFPNDSQEVRVGNHIADVRHNNQVIEFQHSPLSLEKAIEREDEYGENMIWVWDVRERYGVTDEWGSEMTNEWGKYPTIYRDGYMYNNPHYSCFRWKWMNKTISSDELGAHKYLDIGDSNLIMVGSR